MRKEKGRKQAKKKGLTEVFQSNILKHTNNNKKAPI